MRTTSPTHGPLHRRIRAAFGVLASFLLVATVLAMANTGDRHDGPAFLQATDAATTDSLRFQSQLRAATKPIAVEGQWAYANANGTIAQRTYSTNLQTRTQNGGACAYGGSGASCTGQSARSDASVNHNPGGWETSWGSTSPAAYVEFTADFTASVRCEDNGTVSATGGTGQVRYGNDSHVNGTGWATHNITSRGNGATYDHNYQAAPSRSIGRPFSSETWIRMIAVRRWGTDDNARRAWSEINVNWTATQSNTPRTGSVTYRTECGVRMNDGSGSQSPRAAGFAAASPADLEPRTTVTVEQDGEESVIEVDPETGEPLADAPVADEQATSDSSADEQTVEEPQTDEPQATEPQADGLNVESELQNESGDYQLLATRELSETDLAVVRSALDAASAEDAQQRTGVVEGGSWTLFSGDGDNRDLPVIEVEMADGAVVQVRPKIDGAELPSPDVQEGQR